MSQMPINADFLRQMEMLRRRRAAQNMGGRVGSDPLPNKSDALRGVEGMNALALPSNMPAMGPGRKPLAFNYPPGVPSSGVGAPNAYQPDRPQYDPYREKVNGVYTGPTNVPGAIQGGLARTDPSLPTAPVPRSAPMSPPGLVPSQQRQNAEQSPPVNRNPSVVHPPMKMPGAPSEQSMIAPMSSSPVQQPAPQPAGYDYKSNTARILAARAAGHQAYVARLKYRDALRGGASMDQLNALHDDIDNADLAKAGLTAQVPSMRGPQTPEEVAASRARLQEQYGMIQRQRAEQAAQPIPNDTAYMAGQQMLPPNLQERNQQFTHPEDQLNYRRFSQYVSGQPTLDFNNYDLSTPDIQLRRKLEAERAAKLAAANKPLEFSPYGQAEMDRAGEGIKRSQDQYAALQRDAAEAQSKMDQKRKFFSDVTEQPLRTGVAELKSREEQAKIQAAMASGMDPNQIAELRKAQIQQQVNSAGAGLAQSEANRTIAQRESDAAKTGANVKDVTADEMTHTANVGSISEGINKFRRTQIAATPATFRDADMLVQQLTDLERAWPSLNEEHRKAYLSQIKSAIGNDDLTTMTPGEIIGAVGLAGMANAEVARRVRNRLSVAQGVLNRIKNGTFGTSQAAPVQPATK